MKILIVTATKQEVQPLLNIMDAVSAIGDKLFKFNYKNFKIDFLFTGVGMVATSYYTGKIITNEYNFAINVGIAGSFSRNLQIGEVVHVYEDCFSELGAEDGNTFLSLEELKLEGVSKILNSNHQFKNIVLSNLPKVNGITVNTGHGNEEQIEKVVQRLHPIVESMEGAAFMFVCENEKIPYAQVRCISNYIERRNKSAWNIPLAIINLNNKILEILDTL